MTPATDWAIIAASAKFSSPVSADLSSRKTQLAPRQVYHLAGLFFLAVLPYNRRDATRVWAMSYPTIYDVTYSYTGFQAALGDGSFPGTQLDADMAGLSDSVASINAFIQTAFRSDGVLKAASLPGTDHILQYVDEAAAVAAAEATEIATTAATSASASATAAAGAATSAATSETQAASSASAAQTARTGAETAQTAAVAAQTAAEIARTGAETARTGAETARTGAETAQTAAEAAQTYLEAQYPPGQVVFPSVQVPSSDPNVLDDYEEGTFTPAFAATGCTFSYAVRTGRYVKVGKLVRFDLELELNTTGNTLTASALSITGLPFTSGASGAVFAVSWRNSTSALYQVSAFLASGSASVTVQGLITSGGITSETALNANAALHPSEGSRIRMTGTYEAAV